MFKALRGEAVKINKELIGASTTPIILGVIAKSPSYGYQIVKRINDEADDLFIWQEGTVYPVLHKLEKDGLIQSQWQTAETGRRRKYYFITTKGRKALAEYVSTWNDFNTLVVRFSEVAYAG